MDFRKTLGVHHMPTASERNVLEIRGKECATGFSLTEDLVRNLLISDLGPRHLTCQDGSECYSRFAFFVPCIILSRSSVGSVESLDHVGAGSCSGMPINIINRVPTEARHHDKRSCLWITTIYHSYFFGCCGQSPDRTSSLSCCVAWQGVSVVTGLFIVTLMSQEPWSLGRDR